MRIKLLFMALSLFLTISCMQNLELNTNYICDYSDECPPGMECVGFWQQYTKSYTDPRALWVAISFGKEPGVSDPPGAYGLCVLSKELANPDEFFPLEVCDNNKDDDGDGKTDCDDPDCYLYRSPSCVNDEAGYTAYCAAFGDQTPACGGGESPQPYCGNGVIDPGEECDNALYLFKDPSSTPKVDYATYNNIFFTNTQGEYEFLFRKLGKYKLGRYVDNLYTCKNYFEFDNYYEPIKQAYETSGDTPVAVSAGENMHPSCTSDCRLNVISCFYDSLTTAPDESLFPWMTTGAVSQYESSSDELFHPCDPATFTPACAGTLIEYCKTFTLYDGTTPAGSFVVQEFCPDGSDGLVCDPSLVEASGYSAASCSLPNEVLPAFADIQ